MAAVSGATGVARARRPGAAVGPAAAELTVTAALCSVGAAAIHAAVAAPHFEVSALLGVLFVVAALGQALWAARFLVRPSARLVVAGLAGNLAILAGWVLSRTSGLPVGPDAWHPEPVAALDAAASALELVVVWACLVLARRGAYRAPQGVTRFAVVVATALAGVIGAAFFAPPSEGHHHPPASPAEHQHEH